MAAVLKDDFRNDDQLRACVQALGELPALLKPFTMVGTKLRLPKEIGDPLCSTIDQLRPMLDSIHYEGVHYDYQDEAAGAGLRHAAAVAVSAYRCGALGIPDKALATAIDELETQLDVATDTPEVLADADEPPKLKVLLGDAWKTLHGIEQVATMLWQYEPDDPDALPGAAFTIKEAAKRGYEIINEVEELLRTDGA